MNEEWNLEKKKRLYEYGYTVAYEGIKEKKARGLYDNKEKLKDYLKVFKSSDWKKGFKDGLQDRFNRRGDVNGI